MNQRERILAAAVALLAVVLLLNYAAGRVKTLLTQRHDRIAQLEKQIRDKQRIVRAGRQATAELNGYEQRSLPPDPELAGSLYQAWLLELVKRAELADSNVKRVATRARGDLYQQFTFTVTGQGDLSQLTRLLYDFYHVARLHRIQRLVVKPIADSRQLDLAFSIDALALASAPPRNALADQPSGRLDGSLADYEQVIVMRNLFAPANNPPRLATISSQRGYVNQRLAFTVEASDPDQGQKLTYSLEADELPGARIDRTTGRFEWTPRQTGEFEVTVKVTDDGLPAKSDQRPVRIRVETPPPARVVEERPRPPAFDMAGHTFLVGVSEAAGRPQAWLSVRPTGELLKLSEGDLVQVGSIEGVVMRIDAREVEIETADKRLVVELGYHLGQAQQLPLAGL